MNDMNERKDFDFNVSEVALPSRDSVVTVAFETGGFDFQEQKQKKEVKQDFDFDFN